MKIFTALKKEVFSHKLTYLLLGVVLLFAIFLRVYRIGDLLGFHYDQGRDALVIWDLIKNGKLFLIGPTTGLAGIFRGPYYYYLIAPFYFLGGENPVFPSVFLSLTTVAAILLGYFLGFKIQGRVTGLIFSLLSSFSFFIVTSSRWLSNPTPMFLLSMFLVLAMFLVSEGKRWAWVVIAIISGLSLFNFGSSGELFYFPAIFIFLVWQWKNRPNLKLLLLSVFLFILTFAPLVLFDFKHEYLLLNNITKTFGQEKSFALPNVAFISERSDIYYNVFSRELFHQRGTNEIVALVFLLLAFVVFLPKLIKNSKVRILLLLLSSAIFGLYFYQGNYGVLYDYYLTGYFLIFLLLVAVVLGQIWQNKVGKVLVVAFLILFLSNNYSPLKFVLSINTDTPGAIYFKNQKQAVDFVYKNANGQDFNVDVYVPPVIPYSYDYLFTWYGPRYHGYAAKKDRVELLYTLYEEDPPHPERLTSWLDRQKGIGKVMEAYKSGGITVERRLRIK